MMTDEKTVTRLGVFGKLAKVSAACAYLQRDGNNQAQRYRYLSEAHVKKAVTKAVVEAGLSYGGTEVEVVETFEVETNGGRKWRGYTVKARVTITDPEGHGFVVFEGLGSGTDSGDKAVMKATTAAVKTALTHGLGISSGDDPEADESTDVATAARFGNGETSVAPQAVTTPSGAVTPRPGPAPRRPSRPATPGEWAPDFGRKKGIPLTEFTRKEAYSLRQWFEEKIQREPGSRYRAEWELGVEAIDAYFRDTPNFDEANPGAPEKHERYAPDAPDPAPQTFDDADDADDADEFPF